VLGTEGVGARHTRPNETNQAAASSAWPRRTARHPWFRSDRSRSAKVTATLPFGADHHPLTRRHGPAAAHARAADHHSPVPRCAPLGMAMTRAPAGPRRCRAARDGGRAMHLTPSPTAEITAVTPIKRTASARLGSAGGRHRRYGVPMGSRSAARGREIVRLSKVRRASGSYFTPSLSTTS
jgi:hypothetical protein